MNRVRSVTDFEYRLVAGFLDNYCLHSLRGCTIRGRKSISIDSTKGYEARKPACLSAEGPPPRGGGNLRAVASTARSIRGTRLRRHPQMRLRSRGPARDRGWGFRRP